MRKLTDAKVFMDRRGKERRWSQIDADLRAGMRSRDAAAKWGMQATHVSKRRKKLGLAPLPPGRRAGEGDRAPRSAVTDVIIERADMGRGVHEVAIEIGVRYGTVGHAATRWVRGIVGRAGRGPTARAGKEKRGTKKTATWNGETRTLAEWTARTGIKVDTIAYRLRVGWPVERALTEAPGGRAGGGA